MGESMLIAMATAEARRRAGRVLGAGALLAWSALAFWSLSFAFSDGFFQSAAVLAAALAFVRPAPPEALGRADA